MEKSLAWSRRGLLRGAVLIGVLPFLGAAGAQAQTGIQGNWSFAWQGASDNYSGILEVSAPINNAAFAGRLTVRPSKGGTVFEDAQVTVAGNQVRIECSNPASADRNVSDWSPDRFYVVLNGNRMEGYSLDAVGHRGASIVFTRM
ncbi:MAG TPA: hypothetical protein VN795_04070 [Stellaceae bacterium]|jgi:hypothetical protein|nr:hypothetical protein [Stellaceae bacterium]